MSDKIIWQSMDTAPRDGTEIWGRYDGEPVEILYAETRQCMGIGIGHGNGYFGAGWEDVENGLIADNPDAWAPIPPEVDDE